MTPLPATAAARLARWWPLAAAVAIAFITWPVGSLVPTNGLDPSWRIALSMAVARGVDFGDIAFTYGPLGFLEAPLNAEPHTLLPALAWIGLIQIGFAYLVIECSRRSFPWPVAVALAFVACQLLDQGREVLPLIAFLWAALVVQWGVPARVGRVLLPVSGVVGAAGLLIKFNEGIVALVLAGIAAWWLEPRRWRALGVFAGSAAAGLVALWAILGNGVGGLAGWLHSGLQVAGGYSAGLSYLSDPLTFFPNGGRDYPLFIVLVASIGWFAWLSGEGLARSRRIGMGLLGAALAFSLFKHGFVRHDPGHAASTFTALIAAAAAVRWSRPSGRLAGAGVCLAAVLGSLFVLHEGDPPAGRSFFDPRPRIETATDQLRLVASPSRRRELRDSARRDLRALHAIPAEIVAALEGHTVHVDPYETSIIWAYHLAWRPAPVFQDYAVFTNALDRANAASLTSSRAPERILRHGGPRIDGHSPEGEGPEQLRAMICGYRQQVAATGWQVLRRAAPRCGPERPLGSVSARSGETIAIPPAPTPDDMVMARIHLPLSVAERLRTALYKPSNTPEVLLDARYGYRIPASLAAGPLLVSAPASVGWADYAAGFRFSSLRVSYVASPFRVDFVTMRVAPSAPGG